jgi:hypothetical protein
MQTTANLWELLCRDFESEPRSAKAEQHHGIAIRFLQAAEMQTVIANREALLQETGTKQ